MAAAADKGEAAALQQAFSEITRQMKAQDHEKVLKSVNKALELKKGDSNLEHAKAIALVRLDRYDDALKLIGSLSDTEFEKAYCEYRLQKPADALQTISAVRTENRRNKELLGQLLYRLERYGESYETYTQLLKDSSLPADSDARDRRANQLGTLAATALWNDQAIDTPPRLLASTNESYAAIYNEACTLVGMQRFEDALASLDRAEQSCQRQFEEDGYSNEELEAELAFFRVQRGYIAMRRAEFERNRASGQSNEPGSKASGPNEETVRRLEDEASRLFNGVLKLKASGTNDVDQQLVAVAANNLICLNREANLFDSRKKAKLLQAEGLANKLVVAQRYATQFNQTLLYFYANQLEQCRKSLIKLTEMRQESGSLALPSTYSFMELRLQVALAAREKQPAKAIDALQAFIAQKTSAKEKATDADSAQQFVGACLQLVELHVAEGRVRDAISSLQRVADSDAQPFNLAVFTRLLALFDAANDFDAAHAFVLRTVRTLRSRVHGGELTQLLTVVTQFYARHRRVDEAMRVLDELAVGDALQNVSADSLANLIGVFARFSLERAERMIKQLPAVTQKRVDEIAAKHSLNLDALETAFLYGQRAFTKKATTAKADGAAKPRDETAQDKKNKKKRKKRVPKNYNPNVPPDPERWLPKRERSTFKAKMARRDKRRGAEMRVGGTQGAIVRDTASDQPSTSATAAAATAGAAGSTVKATKGQPQQPAAPPPTSPTPPSNAGNKKKGGKKRH